MNRAFGALEPVLLCSIWVFSLEACGGSFARAESPAGAARAAPVLAAPDGRGAPATPAPAPNAPSRAKSDLARTSGAKDSTARELLAYEATVTIGVYRVDQAIATVLDVSRILDGQVVVRNDDQVVFRVPRSSFEDALARVDEVGDVIHRDVRAEDVGDQYRDLDVRLRNARAVRDRLAELLARASTVEDSLKIEAELGRVTEEIERLGGELELLGNRVAYSKITVVFRARHVEEVREDVMRLPFSWLKTLGLPRLLDLTE